MNATPHFLRARRLLVPLLLLLPMALAGCDLGPRAAPAPLASDMPSQRALALASAAAEPAPSGDACVVKPQRTTSDASGRKTRFTMATVRCAAPVARPSRKRTLVASAEPSAAAAPSGAREAVRH